MKCSSVLDQNLELNAPLEVQARPAAERPDAAAAASSSNNKADGGKCLLIPSDAEEAKAAPAAPVAEKPIPGASVVKMSLQRESW